MKKFSNNSLKALAFSASAIAFVSAVPAMAQDAEPGEDCVTGTGGAGAPQLVHAKVCLCSSQPARRLQAERVSGVDVL